jgi:hypothetical protein
LPRIYRYVGAKELRALLVQPSRRICIEAAEDVVGWVKATQQPLENDGTVICTLVIDTDKQLWISDRRSEHVVCANGNDVFSAGEITFALERGKVEVVDVTNQSTGYCPEPESWWAVESALEQVGIAHPTDFTTAYVFRRCDRCGTINLVKDMWFECDVCNEALSREWNFDSVDE